MTQTKVIAGVTLTNLIPPSPNWISEPVEIPLLRKQIFPIEISYVSDDDDNHFLLIERALSNFLNLNETDRTATERHLYAYYRDVLLCIGEEALTGSGCPLLENESGIFDLLTITEVDLSQYREGSDFFVCVMGECKWEPEHGVQIAYRHGQRLAKVTALGDNLVECDKNLGCIYDGSSTSSYEVG